MGGKPGTNKLPGPGAGLALRIHPALLKSMGLAAIWRLSDRHRGVIQSLTFNPNKRGDDRQPVRRSTLEKLVADALVFTPKTTDQEVYVILRYVQLIEGLRQMFA
jgi:hypothetical protein